MNRVEDTWLWKLLDRSFVDYVWALFGVLFAILVMAWMIAKIRAWFTGDDDPAESDHQLLASVRELNREGDLTDDEYRSIKSRLVDRLDDAADPSV